MEASATDITEGWATGDTEVMDIMAVVIMADMEVMDIMAVDTMEDMEVMEGTEVMGVMVAMEAMVVMDTSIFTSSTNGDRIVM